uniref:UNC-45/Cro1/She4 central domain-containing protein n=1 Tax=Candidozyma auris TaxID=498019 RepID=A0A0L0NYK3_CANAR
MSTLKECQAFLKSNELISEEQLKHIKLLPEKEKVAFIDIIASDPSEYLPRLEHFGTEGAAIVLSGLQDKDKSLQVIEICKKKLRQSLTTQTAAQFFLSIYGNVSAKYDITDPLLIPVVLELISDSKEELHAAVVFLVVSFSKRDPKGTSKAIQSYLSNIVANTPLQITPSQYSLLFETFDLFFPIFPEQLKTVYTSDGCKNAVLYQAARLTGGSGEVDGTKVAKMLKVVSLTCIDETSRNFNSQNYLNFLISGTEMTSSPLIMSYSLLCIVKLWNFKQISSRISQRTVLTKVIGVLKNGEPGDARQAILETLAYLSLSGGCREEIFRDEKVTEKLIELLESEKDSLSLYGVLTVFSNLTKVKEDLDNNERRRLQYAASASNPGNENLGQVSEESVKLYNTSLIQNHCLVGKFKKLDLSKANILKECVTIIYHLSRSPENILQRALVQQGALVLILKNLTATSSLDKNTGKTQGVSTDEGEILIRINALRALASLCLSVNPRLAFNEYDITSAVPFLTELFGVDLTFGPAPTKNATTVLASLLSHADKFRALLALTNLCSQPNKDLNNFVIKCTFDSTLKNLIIESTVPDIQRAAWELINNLIQEPAMLAKFFNPDNPESMKNLDLLVKMLHAQDEKLQEVIAGVLANSTMEYEFVTTVILSQTRILTQIKTISAEVLMGQPDASGLMLRLGTFLGNLMDVAASKGNNTFKDDKNLLLGFEAVIQETNIPEVSELFTELIKMTIQ